MTGIVWDFVTAVLTLFAEAAPYLLVGFFVAGLLRLLISEEKICRYLGQDNLKSVVLAALFGAPLPLCSCSVLPAAALLKRTGASKGATTSFLISTPETGVDSISVTYALMDPIMTVLRPLAAVVTAITTGSIVNLFVRKGWEAGRGDGELGKPAPSERGPESEAACSGNSCPGAGSPASQRRGVRGIVTEASSYAFRTLMDDLSSWLLLGFLISGVIVVAVPDRFFEETIPAGWVSSLLMVLVATPMYVCATSATPIAVSLIAKGLDPGAALVLLLVGPATNVTTMLVVARFLGKRILAVYLVCIVGLALLLGALVNVIYAEQGIRLASVVAAKTQEGVGPMELVAALLLALLLARSAVRIGLLRRWGAGVRRLGAPLGIDPLSATGRAVIVAVIALVYASSAFTVIGPGEVGWVERFGRVVRHLEEPALYVHWPAPIDRVQRLRDQEVRGVEFGFEREGASGTTATPLAGHAQGLPGIPHVRDLAAEAEVMDGEENILRLTFGVHFAVAEPYSFQYRLADPVQLVRAMAESAMRQTVARRTTSEILVDDRAEIERCACEILQQELQALDSGIRITTVTLLDAHAPEAVHPAFRDVASALEDKARRIRQAEGYQFETLAAARAKAYALEKQAEGYRSEKVNLPRGEARAFTSRLRAYQAAAGITRLRLFYEQVQKALARARLILLLGDDVKVDLWNVNRGEEKTPERTGEQNEVQRLDEDALFPFGKEFLPPRK
ncbi:MAG: SO_0444 family Cu/Zn efflux transporter [Planctomycetota bacterium]